MLLRSLLRSSRWTFRWRYLDAEKCRDDLGKLRPLLPQFNFAGLWKGFDDRRNDAEVVIRLRYLGDEVFAEKVRGGQLA